MTDSSSDTPIFLPGLALSGYRSFGQNIQFIEPFAQINVFAGPNNAGKSNLLRFIYQHMNDVVSFRQPYDEADPTRPFEGLTDSLDLHRSENTQLAAGIAVEVEFVIECASKNVKMGKSNSNIKLFEKFVKLPAINRSEGLAWHVTDRSRLHNIDNEHPINASLFRDDIKEQADQIAADFKLAKIWEVVRTNTHNARLSDSAYRASFMYEIFFAAIPYLPRVHLLPAFRQIQPSSVPPGSIKPDVRPTNGEGLIDLFAELERPDYSEQFERQSQYELIQEFFRDVTGEPNSTLTVPGHGRYFQVNRSGRLEPLDSLGTGIHQLVLFAIYVTLCKSAIVCIEEPEVYLHPSLQRKLIAYLRRTNNQYFIATHSSHFLDIPGARVFRVEPTPNGTDVKRVALPADRFAVSTLLGCRASDIVQANCVVWVEGPSELIYIRRWVHEIDPKLREGIEYSVMFYGGGLRSWLTGDDPEEAKELISLVAINRHCAFVMDSDRRNSEIPLQANKLRVQKSIEGHGLVWITQGREIENYIPFEQRSRCVHTVRPTVAPEVEESWPYGHALPEEAGKGSKVDKVKFAKAVVSEPVEWGATDLKLRVFELVNYIRKANHQRSLPVPEDLRAHLPGEELSSA